MDHIVHVTPLHLSLVRWHIDREDESPFRPLIALDVFAASDEIEDRVTVSRCKADLVWANRVLREVLIIAERLGPGVESGHVYDYDTGVNLGLAEDPLQ